MEITDIDIPIISIEELNKINCRYSGKEVLTEGFLNEYITNLIISAYNKPGYASPTISKTLKKLGLTKVPGCITILSHLNNNLQALTKKETVTETSIGYNINNPKEFSQKYIKCQNCPALMYFQIIKIYLECFKSYIDHINDDFSEIDIKELMINEFTHIPKELNYLNDLGVKRYFYQSIKKYLFQELEFLFSNTEEFSEIKPNVLRSII